ncbi:MAG TPA: [protein-PII] uridylyltransferase [Candidatus Binatia bacterium]|nr:[protein-PII] uridylyltransferase [Candidatus Binatia bacterium]
MDAVAISLGLLEAAQEDHDLKRLARNYISRGRRELFERHRAGAGGLEIAAAWSTVMDHLIRHLFNVISAEWKTRLPDASSRFAIVAQGGYGRGELNPQSDVDLLFLYSWKVSPFGEAVAEKLLYTLWDAGLQVGHATRTVAECTRLAENDLRVRTSLLDARFLCGDFALYESFEKSVESRLLKKGVGRFIREKLAENERRHEEFGGSVYLLEPDVKEGEGGLRDIQTARWIARAKLRVKDLDGLALNGLVSPSDIATLKEAQDFLMRVRNELHFATGKHQDQLTFEQQENVSQALGFQGEGALRGVEVFMRTYYLHAAEISRISSLIAHRVTESRKPRFGGKYVFGRTLREGVRLIKGQIVVTKPEVLTSEPANLMRIFDDAQKYGCPLAEETRELLRQHLALIDDDFRRTPEVNAIFFGILSWKERVYETLLEMHRTGVLGALIPEFGRLLCMALHDAYHIYTVDQHSLRLIKEIERLKSGEYLESLPLLTQLAREAERIELLYLGLMFHDIGKGFGGGHSEIGARMVHGITRRLRLNPDDGAMVEFLVRHHLLMTHTAFRRDLEDGKTIFDFAKTMGSVNHLKMLYLLTFADVKAVGPDVWNPWKASLLGELYVKALNLLEEAEKGEFQRPDVLAIVRRVQARVRRELSEHYDEKRIERFLAAMPDRYFLGTPENDIVEHFQLMERFRGKKPEIAVRHFPERDCTSVVVCAQDRPGLFASITGVFAALHLDILNARIFTASDGRILDVFRISHHGRSEGVMAEPKWNKFRSILEDVLEGKIDVARLVESTKPSLYLKRAVPKVSTVVNVDNEASDDFTIVEVFTEDRIGVLFAITHSLHRLGLSIHVAKISTNVDQVADVFYVTDRFGAKIQDAYRVETLRQSLYETLAPERHAEQGSVQPDR